MDFSMHQKLFLRCDEKFANSNTICANSRSVTHGKQYLKDFGLHITFTKLDKYFPVFQ